MALYGDLTFDSRVRREARSLVEVGYAVTIVCLASEGSRTDLPGNVTVLVRRPTGAAIIPGAPNPYKTTGTSRLASAAGRVRWLADYVRGLRSWGRIAVEAAGPVDAWHAHDLTGLAAIVPSLRGEVPVVYDSHELFLEAGTAAALPPPARRALRRYERHLVARTAAVITVNDEIAALLRRRYRPRRTAVVHNCPPLAGAMSASASHIRDEAGIPAGAPIVLYHGGLTAGRGIELLTEALLADGMQGVHLVLMGYGDMRDGLRDQARAAPFWPRLHVLDAVPPTSLVEWISSADVGAMPNPGRTLNDVHSSPNKLFECLAAGTPVVASDFPVIRRIIVDNPGGALGAVCRPGDSGSLAAALRSLLYGAPAEKIALRDRCRRAAVERWNWERESLVLLDVYAEILPVRPRASSPSTSAKLVG
jgi:glycosyltransferase involved in cell wall biosynthesis